MSFRIDAVALVDDPEEEIWTAQITFASGDEARAFGARVGREIIIEMPDAQPPDVYEARIPEEEAKVNAPKGKR